MSRLLAATIDAEDARRLLLGGQGLMDDPTRRVTQRSLQSLIEQMGYVQIDSINVVERAHHLTLASRMDDYSHDMLKHLLERNRTLFEHWTHDASAIPAKWFPYWRHRFERDRKRIQDNKWWRKRVGPDVEAVIAHVRERIEREGPLQSRDFEHDRNESSGAWWGWKPQKAVLEYLWRAGELAIARRVNFQKVYDLTERVFPESALLKSPDSDEHVAWACHSALDRLGVATPSEIAEFWKAVSSAEVKRWCESAADCEEIERVLVASADTTQPPRRAYAVADWRDRLEHKPYADSYADRMRLLSPFDPVVRDRKRLKRLFDFSYSFEAFVPEPKRVYGYYVLPILHRDRFVGRIDPKFHRNENWLEIRNVWWEPGVKGDRKRTALLEEAVNRLALFIGAQHWSLP